MKYLFNIVLCGWVVLSAQPGTKNDAVRAIRLENLRQNYTGKTIRFISENSQSIQGILLDVTQESFILSEQGTPVSYTHSNINYVFIDPDFNDMLIVFGMSSLGAAAGFLSVSIGHSNPDINMKGVVTTLGAGLAGIMGHKAFYKPIKIDLSGKLHEP